MTGQVQQQGCSGAAHMFGWDSSWMILLLGQWDLPEELSRWKVTKLYRQLH